MNRYIDNSVNWQDIDNEWDNYYNISVMSKNEDVVSLDGGCIVLKREAGWLEFTVFEYASSTEDVTYGKRLFYGEGSTSLRELRHKWFAPYINYINCELIESAFKELRNYFNI